MANSSSSSSSSDSSIEVKSFNHLPRKSHSSSKRLLFDRRYGWVIDEWKEPSQEALSGGRGMFCILPLAKVLLNIASCSINVAATNMGKVIERPELLSPPLLQAKLGHQFSNIKSYIEHAEFNSFLPKLKSPPETIQSAKEPFL